MRVKRSGWVLLGVCGGLLMARAAEAEQVKAAEPVAAVKQWLALTDSGKYAESWEAAAAYFRGAVSKEQWAQSMTAVRAPLGALRSRTLLSQHQAASLPGAPDGDYTVLRYDTSFEKKQSAVETVTTVHEPDGTSKVVGYYIK